MRDAAAIMPLARRLCAFSGLTPRDATFDALWRAAFRDIERAFIC